MPVADATFQHFTILLMNLGGISSIYSPVQYASVHSGIKFNFYLEIHSSFNAWLLNATNSVCRILVLAFKSIYQCAS